MFGKRIITSPYPEKALEILSSSFQLLVNWGKHPSPNTHPFNTLFRVLLQCLFTLMQILAVFIFSHVMCADCLNTLETVKHASGVLIGNLFNLEIITAYIVTKGASQLHRKNTFGSNNTIIES